MIASDSLSKSEVVEQGAQIAEANVLVRISTEYLVQCLGMSSHLRNSI